MVKVGYNGNQYRAFLCESARLFRIYSVISVRWRLVKPLEVWKETMDRMRLKQAKENPPKRV